jgi:hypothetical protein
LKKLDKKWRLTTCLAFGIGVSIVTATGRLLYVAVYRAVSKPADAPGLARGLKIREKAGGGKDLPSEFISHEKPGPMGRSKLSGSAWRSVARV